MWGWGALALAVSLIVSIPSLLSLMAALGIATALPLSASALSTLITVCGLLNWGVRIASCLFGFYLFRQSAARRMRAMKDDSTDDDRYRTELERRGRAVPCGRGPWWACCCWCAALRFPHGSDRIA